MVTEEQVMNLILQKFPSFNDAWEKHLAWWENDKPGLCNDISVFSRYVIELIQKGESEEKLKEIFTFVEKLMNEGSQKVQEAVATCFLENLINATSWETISPASFVNLLGPESKEYCKAWDEFTKVKTAGLWDDKK